LAEPGKDFFELLPGLQFQGCAARRKRSGHHFSIASAWESSWKRGSWGIAPEVTAGAMPQAPGNLFFPEFSPRNHAVVEIGKLQRVYQS
jgi:hypothetical protein